MHSKILASPGQLSLHLDRLSKFYKEFWGATESEFSPSQTAIREWQFTFEFLRYASIPTISIVRKWSVSHNQTADTQKFVEALQHSNQNAIRLIHDEQGVNLYWSLYHASENVRKCCTIVDEFRNEYFSDVPLESDKTYDPYLPTWSLHAREEATLLLNTSLAEWRVASIQPSYNAGSETSLCLIHRRLYLLFHYRKCITKDEEFFRVLLREFVQESRMVSQRMKQDVFRWSIEARINRLEANNDMDSGCLGSFPTSAESSRHHVESIV